MQYFVLIPRQRSAAAAEPPPRLGRHLGAQPPGRPAPGLQAGQGRGGAAPRHPPGPDDAEHTAPAAADSGGRPSHPGEGRNLF